MSLILGTSYQFPLDFEPDVGERDLNELYIGVTDNDWYRFLRQLPNVDEVNFWQPLTFAQLRIGEKPCS